MASKIVWLDAFTANVDRTPRNANMLLWHKELWLIDHGAAFFITVYKYDEKGILNEMIEYHTPDFYDRFIYKYDLKGNLIEAERLRQGSKGDIDKSKTVYSKYKLDSNGNWIARTETDLDKYGGKLLEYVYKNTRKIEYFK